LPTFRLRVDNGSVERRVTTLPDVPNDQPKNTEGYFKNRDSATVVLHLAYVLKPVLPNINSMLVGSVASTGLIVGLELARRHPKTAQRIYDAFADDMTERAAAEMDLCILNDGHKGQICDASDPPSEGPIRPSEPTNGV